MLLQDNDIASRIALASFTMNGYGLPADTNRALDYLHDAASRGHLIARANLCRMYVSCGRDIPDSKWMVILLYEQAHMGSRMAAQDLKELDTAKAVDFQRFSKRALNGVGAPWYANDQWFFGITIRVFQRQQIMLERLNAEGENLEDVVVNRKGERILHASAAVGALDVVQKLVEDYGFDVNRVN
jgi:hypothetical protein